MPTARSSKLTELQKATSLADLANLLGYSPTGLAYIIYKLTPSAKYTTFTIPKKSGVSRTIEAPTKKLKKLQRRLANLLYECSAEIRLSKPRRVVSHGFKKGHSIFTNAKQHKCKRYVLNFDIENFFPSINFGRVRGFFIKSSDFKLHESVATVLAQIACHNNALPQGSPCSPVISDLVTHLLDLRMLRLAKANGLTYSRYADDLTFSTNLKSFPAAFALKTSATWTLSPLVVHEVKKAGFSVNASKTRVHYRNSRQMVTGLTVNTKVNVRNDFHRSARAMCNAYFSTGSYKIGAAKLSEAEKLGGIINHIYYVKNASDLRPIADRKKYPSGPRKLYHRFLFFKNFVVLKSPLILCEGETDQIYLRAALKTLTPFHGLLGKPPSKVLRFFSYGKTAHDVLQLGGGTGDLKYFINSYDKSFQSYKFAPAKFPVIILVDNDDGIGQIVSLIKDKFRIVIDVKVDKPFYYLGRNLYLIKTPAMGKTGHSRIEDLFDKSILATKINGKTFNPADKINPATEYGKVVFARKVIRPNASKIDFSKFEPLLKNIIDVLSDYKAP